jgi:hypothetical protein
MGIWVIWGAAAALPWEEKLRVKTGWAAGFWEATLIAAEVVGALPMLGEAC